MLLGWVWASRTGLMAFREGPQPTMFFGSLFFPILDDLGSKMGVQKPSFLGNFEGQKSQKFRRKWERVQDSHSGRILEGF